MARLAASLAAGGAESAVIMRLFIVLHRWLVVALCLFFLPWFPSVIGMV